MAALDAGQIDIIRARIIAEATHVLSDEHTAAVEDRIFPRAGQQTSGQLRAALARAVLAADPDAARARREEAQRDARVLRWREDAGTAALCGRDLPSADVLAADQRISARARQLRSAGVTGTLDELRARAYLDFLLGRDSMPPPQPSAEPGTATPPGESPAGGSPASNPPASNPPAGGPPAGGSPASNPPASNPPAGGPPASNPPAGGPPAGGSPASGSPASNPSAGGPPAGNPPAGDPPAGEPPAGEPPAGEPPAGEPPAGEPPAGEPPASGMSPAAADGPRVGPVGGRRAAGQPGRADQRDRSAGGNSRAFRYPR